MEALEDVVLTIRLLTGNFEEATLARTEGRPPSFTDER